MIHLRFLLILGLFFHNAIAQKIPDRCHSYLPVIEQAERGLCKVVDHAFKGSQILVESSCKDNARSHVGARYATQFMPATERWVAQIDPVTKALPSLSRERGVRMQAWYLCYLYKEVEKRVNPPDECNHFLLMFAAYHSGPHGVLRHKQNTWSATKPRLGRYGRAYPGSILKYVTQFHVQGWPLTHFCREN